MTSTSDPACWRAIVGTARGAAHDLRGMPNQDSAESLDLASPLGTVVAVADGHGHDRHFRSAVGSLLAVRTACLVTARLAAELAAEGWDAKRAAALRDLLPASIVAEWREAVAQDLAESPYTAEELSALEHVGDGPEIPYGSTLLVALIADGWLVCAQIGDGDVLGVRPDGEAWSPVAGDDLLDGYRTTSLCQPDAVDSFRVSAHDVRRQPLLALLLGTDGYGNAQVEDPWQPEVAHDLAKLAAGHDHEWFIRQVPRWAERCASAEGSGDDTTIALLLAPDSAELASPVTTANGTGAAPLVGTLPPMRLPSPAATVLEPPVLEPPVLEPPVPGSPVSGGPGPSRPRHAAATARPAFSRRIIIAAASVAVAAGAITAAVLALQPGSHGSPGSPAHGSTARPAAATSSARPIPSVTAGTVKPRQTGTPAKVARASTPARSPSATGSTPSTRSTGGHKTHNQGG
jgi:hypothetical protein